MEQELSQGVTAVKSLTAAVFEGGTSFQSLVSNISAVGFAAKLHILGVAMQAIGGLANMFKGLFEGMTNTENQLVRLGTSLRGMGRDATKAGDIFEQAMDKAAETPFDLQQVLHSVTQLGGYGIAALDQLKKKNGEVIRDIRGLPVTLIDALGNVAGATGMSLDRTMEAYADAIMGEWERMKQFGIKKEMIPGLAALQAGTPEYKRLIAEWMATSERFAGGMFKQSRTIAGMMSNFGDVFTRFGIATGGAADRNLANNQEATLRTGSKAVMSDIKSGKTTASQAMQDYKVNPEAFKGVIEGSKEFNRRLELAIRYSTELTEKTDTIGKAGTLYDAVRISVRQLYNAFGESSKGISVLGQALGQWLKQIWITFIYPLFTAIADFFRWLGKVGMDFQNSFVAHAAVAGDKADEIARKQRGMVESIGMVWAVFLSFIWNPLIEAIGTAMFIIVDLFDTFSSGFAKSSGQGNIFQKIWVDLKTVFREVWDAVSGLFAIFGRMFAIIEGTGVLQNFFGLLGRIASFIWDRVIGAFRILIAVVSGFFEGLWEAFAPAFKAISEAFSGLFKALNEVFDDLFGGDAMKSFFEVLKEVFGFLAKVLGFIIGTIFKAIGFVIGLIIDGIKWLIKGIGWVIRGLIDAGKWVYDGMGKAFGWIAEKFRSWIIDPIKSIGGFFSDVFDGIMAGIRRAVNFIREYTPGMDTRGVATGKDAYEAVKKFNEGKGTLKETQTAITSAFGSFSGDTEKFNPAFKAATATTAAFKTNAPEILAASQKLAMGEKEVVINLNVSGKTTKFKINGAAGTVEEVK